MSTKSGEKGCPCFVLDLRRFSPSSMKLLAVGLLYVVLIILRCVLSMPTFQRVFTIKGVEFYQEFFYIE